MHCMAHLDSYLFAYSKRFRVIHMGQHMSRVHAHACAAALACARVHAAQRVLVINATPSHKNKMQLESADACRNMPAGHMPRIKIGHRMHCMRVVQSPARHLHCNCEEWHQPPPTSPPRCTTVPGANPWQPQARSIKDRGFTSNEGARKCVYHSRFSNTLAPAEASACPAPP